VIRTVKKILSAFDFLQGWPFGRVFPPRKDPPFPTVDGRSVALSMLALYISELTFLRPGAIGKPPIPMRIPLENIFIEEPDANVDLKMPSIVFRDIGGGDYLTIGLCSFIDEATYNKFGRGTVLQVQTEYNETVTVEIWASTRAERRAIIAGLECALVPTEQLSGIRFLLPDYYDQTATFTLNRSTRVEDNAGQNRRLARLEVEMRFNVVRPVNVVEMTPSSAVDVSDVPGTIDVSQVAVGEPPQDPDTQ
jgi:hypothetical protein